MSNDDNYGRGGNYHQNPIQVQDRSETVEVSFRPNVTNAHIENVWSSRRDTSNTRYTSSNFKIYTSVPYKMVTRIDLIGARIPVDTSMDPKKSVYLFIKAQGQDLSNIQFAKPFEASRSKDEAKDVFSLDGCFAQFFMKTDPIFYEDVSNQPTITYNFQQPLGTLTTFDVRLVVEPTDPTAKAKEDFYVAPGEDIRLVFRILSQN
uniref:Penton protein single jelly roll n=1 Tax=Clandestinovirus TaxID=2831644 RepID=A0A8F8KPU4_9VIRU|nr:penton protein single jelly roll [Clandestinovirus]